MQSRLSAKGQVTIPVEVRRALGLEAGDLVVYELRDDDEAVLRRLSSVDAQFHRALEATLDEWSSPGDEAAFRDL